MSRWRLLIAGAAAAALATTGTVAVSAPAHASICDNLGFTGGDVGSTGSSGSSDIGLGSADFGSYRADGKKPQQPLPKLHGVSTAIEWVTGPRSPSRTDLRFSITSADVGVPWDNGSGQVLMAFGDTWGKCGGQMVWRHNTMLRSDGNSNLDKGVTFPDPIPGSIRSGASVTPQYPNFAQPMLNAAGVRNIEVGKIPTGGISINGTQYLSYMSIHNWGSAGRWVTNYSALAVSHDNGQTWNTDNDTIRTNLNFSLPGVNAVQDGNGRFQVGAFLRTSDWIYQYGTPNGRFGAAFVSRFKPADILNLNAYQYYAGGGRWSPRPVDAVAIVHQPVSEMSVAYNNYLGKYVMLDETGGDILLRTSPTPAGPWSDPRVIVPVSQTQGLYAPYIHPWGASGSSLYFVASRWDDYNVMLIKTDLSKVR